MNPLPLFVSVLLAYLHQSGVCAYDEFGKACLVAHNKLRTLHGSQPLVWSEDLAGEAQKWCEELALNDVLEHDNKTLGTKNQGENIAAANSSNLLSGGPSLELCKMIVERWYMEEQNYNYQTGMPKAPGLPIKHFAQVVWNSSYETGAGTARSTAHGDIVCIRYRPRGGEGGSEEFIKNIFPKKGSNPSLNVATAYKDINSNLAPCVKGYNGGYGGGSGQGCNGGGGAGGSQSCGIAKQSRIVGGKRADIKEFPWQVGFKSWPSRTGSPFCGGSLIDKKWVLSAAHCFQRSMPDLTVVLGEFDTENEEGNEVLMKVRKVTNHPWYNWKSMDYDMALVELEGEVSYNDNMRPVCLPKNIDFEAGKMCTVTGFGAIRENDRQSKTLMKADVPLVAMGECKRSYHMTPEGEKLKVCAGYPEGRIDSCQGDSGGPLVCLQGNKYYLKGVVSYGIGCAKAGYPGVYANVKNSEFLKWIEDTKRSAGY